MTENNKVKYNFSYGLLDDIYYLTLNPSIAPKIDLSGLNPEKTITEIRKVFNANPPTKEQRTESLKFVFRDIQGLSNKTLEDFNVEWLDDKITLTEK